MRFIPITVPFYYSALEDAVALILEGVRDIKIALCSLRLLVNETNCGGDLKCRKVTNLVPVLVRMFICERARWQDVVFADATHIINFGPGGPNGVGALIQRNTVGSGTRVVLTGALRGTGSEIGSTAEIFDSNDSSIRWGNSWS